VRGGSRLEVSAVDDRSKSQTSTATPAEPGELLISLGGAEGRARTKQITTGKGRPSKVPGCGMIAIELNC